MANVRCDMLQIRTADNTVLVASHGRGFFTATWDVVTGIAEKTQQTLQVFPNPSSGAISVNAQLTGSGTLDILVSDASGRVVLERQEAAQAGPWHTRLDLGNQPRGLYFIALKQDGKTRSSEKIVLY